MQQVKAKVTCTDVSPFGGGKTVKFIPVNSKEGDNADYAAAAPAGHIELNINDGRPAADFFKPGKSYYLTFEAEAEQNQPQNEVSQPAETSSNTLKDDEQEEEEGLPWKK